jgi:hypothetical protein
MVSVMMCSCCCCCWMLCQLFELLWQHCDSFHHDVLNPNVPMAVWCES